MKSGTRLAGVGILSAILFSVAACGGSGTATPTAAPSEGAATAAPTDQPTSPAAAASQPAGGGGGGGGGGGTIDVGTLVTADMAGTIIGGSPTKYGGTGTVPGMSTAIYTNAAGDTVTVLVETVPGGIANAELQAAIAAAGAQGNLVAISGLGDAAGKEVDTYSATVAFVKGTNLVVVAASTSTVAGTDLEPKVEAVARQVAGQL